MANALVAIGLVVLALVLTAMALAVAFATRGAMAGNREIIDVLHLVGAEDRFIAGQFQRHFLKLGLRGGAIGGALAIVAFLIAGALTRRWIATPGGDQVEALFGAFSLGWAGYAAILVIAGLVAAITAVVSRGTVFRNLRGLD
jgi:cell division transport system permease protein